MTLKKATYLVEIEGIRPILFCTFPMDALSQTKKKSGTTGDNSEEWKNTVLMSENRELYVHNTYLHASIANGGKEIKQGKATIAKKVMGAIEIMEKRIFFGLFVPEDKALTRLDTEEVYLDVRSVVNPMTKGRNLRYRIAARPGWKISFHITWNERIVSRENIRQCIEYAGDLEGIGDARRLGYGRYKLLAFDNKE